jgi:chromosome segregation ATPase
MKPSRTRSRRGAPALLFAAGAAIALVPLGCVSQGAYDDVQTQRDLLREENERLKTSVANLDDERARIAAELDDLRTDRDVLKQKSDGLQRKSAELEQKVPQLERCATDNQTLNESYETLLNDLSSQVSARDSEIERLRQCCTDAAARKAAKTKKSAPKTKR